MTKNEKEFDDISNLLNHDLERCVLLYNDILDMEEEIKKPEEKYFQAMWDLALLEAEIIESWKNLTGQEIDISVFSTGVVLLNSNGEAVYHHFYKKGE